MKCKCFVTYSFGEWVADSKLANSIEEDKALQVTWRQHPAAGFPEFWYQVYFRERAGRYGCVVLQALRRAGPDFSVEWRGERRFLEIESRWSAYVEHQHDLDPRFKGAILAVVCPDPPMPQMRRLLPSRIIQLDPEDFLAWYRKYSLKFEKEIELLRSTPPRRFYLRGTGRRGPPFGRSFIRAQSR